MTMPINLHPQYIIDENGNKISVVLPIEEFENIIQDESIDKIWEDESLKRLEAYHKGKLETISSDEFFNYEY
jgi:spore germination protein GerM